MSDLYINGKWVEGEGEELRSFHPHDEEVFHRTRSATKSQVKESVSAAKNAEEKWKELSKVDRAEYLWEVYDKIKEDVDNLGKIVSKECGKEISEGKADVTEAYHMVEFAAGLGRHPNGEIIPSEIPSKDSYMRRKPVGTIGCITPWNFPVAIPVWHICIPLIFGNTIVFKPSEKTPYCGKKVAKLFDNLPDGVFNMVQGSGNPVGKEIVDNSKTNVVQFTGSAEVGWKINEKVSDDYHKSAACEMGGKNAVLVTDEADMDIALNSGIMSSYKTTGQRCVSSERLIVHSDIYEDFKDKFVKLSKQIKIGNPLDEETFMGPMIDKSQLKKFKQYNKLVREDEDTNVLLDMEELDRDSGYYVGPFVYECEWDNGKDFLTEEVFGPHVALIEYNGDIEEGIRINNDVDYGLAGAVVTEDYRQMNKYRDKAELGLAYANLPSIGAEVQLPFGGIKKSGNGKPSARGIIEFCTERTAWTVNNSKDIELAQGLSSDINLED